MELAFPILVAIGNLVDPPATMINSAGDYVISYAVARFTDGKEWLNKAIESKRIRFQRSECEEEYYIRVYSRK